ITFAPLPQMGLMVVRSTGFSVDQITRIWECTIAPLINCWNASFAIHSPLQRSFINLQHQALWDRYEQYKRFVSLGGNNPVIFIPEEYLPHNIPADQINSLLFFQPSILMYVQC